MQVIVTAIIDQKDVAAFRAPVGKFLCVSSTVESVSRETLARVLADHAEKLVPRPHEKAA